jgi:pyrimidine operon attenuation protein/uracil phosphoribosyltransferase
MTQRIVLDAPDITRAITRIAHEIIESNKGSDDLVLLGIPRRGVPLAHRLAEAIASISGRPEAASELAGSLDITMYRDDLRGGSYRAPEPTAIPPAGIDAKTVVLVDDVLFSGRTIRAALDALADVGRPAKVRLAVLVDRGHRDLPIRADHVGKNLPTSSSERVNVSLAEVDGTDSVSISGGRE